MPTQKSTTLSNKTIVSFLSTLVADATFVQKLKIRYRPYVCPFDELIRYAKDAESVYDIGCGSGQFCALVAEFTNVKNIHGIEIDKRLVRNAQNVTRGSGKKVSFAAFNGSEIPADIKKYDLIYMIDVYHHIPPSLREDIMRQIYKQMKPGSRLMFKDINGASPFVLCNKVHDMIFAHELSREIGFKKATMLMENIGFKVVEKRKKRILVYPHYFLLLEKP